MWHRALVVTGFCGILIFTNGCATTGGCGTGCGDAGCGADFACAPETGFQLPPISQHMPGCGCGAPASAPGCAVPADLSCSCGGNCGCGPAAAGGGGLFRGHNTCAAPAAPVGDLFMGNNTCAAPAGTCTSCPTCAAPVYSGNTGYVTNQMPPAAMSQPAATTYAPPMLSPAPVQNGAPMAPYSQNIPLGVPAPVQTAPAPAATAPAAAAPNAGDVPTPDSAPDGDLFGPGARNYRQPRVIRPVNAVPMGNGYHIQQQSGQIPMRPVQGQVPMRQVKPAGGDDLPTFYLD